ncbi:MAG: hypothetical protein S4CHLAM81_08490 [Chlamydiales bacterium]|nr:hypothetical protein [Chlamydiales bacterium]MCH9635631.1 hypothetical protein [Chlamydiales bacterium]
MVWTIVIPLIVIAACFLLLAIGLLVTLGRTVSILREIEEKLKALNPLTRMIHRLGDIAEERVERIGERQYSPSRDIMDLIFWGISKFRNRGK